MKKYLKINVYTKLMFFFAVITLTVVLSPVLYRNVPSEILGVFCFVQGLFYFLSKKEKFKLDRIELLGILNMLYVFFNFLFTPFYVTRGLIFSNLLMYFVGIVGYEITTRVSLYNNFLKKYIQIIMVINIVSNFFSSVKNKELSKQVTAAGKSLEFKYSNIGNYMYSFVIVVFAIIFLRKYKEEKSLKGKIFYICMFFISCITVFNLSSTISILSLGITLFFIYLFDVKKKTEYFKIMSLIYIIILFFIFKTNVYNVIKILISLISEINGNVGWRLESINELIFGTGQFSYSGGRNELYFSSWQTFKNNILFGIGMSSEDHNGLYIGGHSYILDYLAEYGIVGFILKSSFLILVLKKIILREKNKKNICYVKGISFGMLFFFILNPADSFLVFIIVCIIIPIFFTKNRLIKNIRDYQ